MNSKPKAYPIRTPKAKSKERRYPRPRKPAAPPAWGRRLAVPAEALDISDNIVRLELILKLLKELNPLHIGNIMTQTQRDSCERAVRTTTAVIRGWQRTAKERLAKEYLLP